MPGFTPNAPQGATVQITSGQLATSNNNRRGLIIINASASTVYLAFGEHAAEINKGIVLYPRGSAWFDDHMFVCCEVNAIATAPGLVTFQEFE